MGANVAPPTANFKWAGPISSHRSSPSVRILPSSSRSNPPGSCRFSANLRSESSFPSISRTSPFRRLVRARLNEFSGEEVSDQIEDLGLISEIIRSSVTEEAEEGIAISTAVAFSDSFAQPKLEFPASIERRANRMDIPLSLRIIRKRQQKLEEGFKEVGDLGLCSVKKAFSSMVFIIRELQKFALQMREALLYEDLQEIHSRVQGDLNASFVWLFQKVFSGTPTLMVYVMILLANFTVHSVDRNAAAIEASFGHPNAALTETVSAKTIELTNLGNSKFDSFSGVRKSLIEGSNGGKGGKVGPVASGFEGGDWNSGSSQQLIQCPDDELLEASSSRIDRRESSKEEEEARLWESMVEQAWQMQAGLRAAEVFDGETIGRLVAPVAVEIEGEDYPEYYRTEVMYQMGLSQDPNNTLLLCNYAQFLFLVAHDHDRAEECFKLALQIEEADAEALSKYADFLWLARKDLWGAEERYQQAIAVEPHNPFIMSKYANFLWSTGGEETCLLLSP